MKSEQANDVGSPNSLLLDPLSFTEKEAKKLVGSTLTELVENNEMKLVPGDHGEVVGFAKVASCGSNQFEYCIAVRWTDREGNVSKEELVSKETYRLNTRPAWRRDAAAAVQKGLKKADQIVDQVKRTVRRGYRM